jgi:hypothetical protein
MIGSIEAFNSQPGVIVPNIHSQSPVARVRSIPHPQALFLWVHAGGRCEFPGCNKYLLQHSVTRTAGNFGQLAHIVAFNEAGPRGKSRLRPLDINDIANLMLLCPECHVLIDKHPLDYPVTLLREYKRQHEANVYYATGVKRSQKTAIVCLLAPINGQKVSIPMAQIHKAILPMHPLEKPFCHIDLNEQYVIGKEPEFIASARKIIKAQVDDFKYRSPGERIEHVSVFGLAPIPLLVLLGRRLGSTVPADIFHHHHDKDNWTWKTRGRQITFEHCCVRQGTDPACVALLLNVSGTVSLSMLPADFGEGFSIYEIVPREVAPSTNCIRTREHLECFKQAYEDFLRDLRRTHDRLEAIHLFPAVPPPIAIACGRELMPKVDPVLRVYDFDKTQGGFQFALEVNGHDD